MESADFVIIGGGIAGLSAAARLSRHGRVVVLEGEEGLGYHSSGRSVTFSHYGIGDATVRGLSAYSRSFFEEPPPELSSAPFCKTQSALYAGSDGTMAQLEALYARMAPYNPHLRWVNRDEIAQLCPILRTGPGEMVRGAFDPAGLKLDADALLQSFARAVRQQGGKVRTGERVAEIVRQGSAWSVSTESGLGWSTPVVVNAAGAWADRIAEMAGVQKIGLTPLRRTIIVVDPPEGTRPSTWPFVHTVSNDFYMLPEAGRLLVSPVDETPSDPCDAQPEEYDIALTAAKLEEYTTLTVKRIAHSWAGLRSFVRDRVPTAGFAPGAPGFFWLTGQGGYGLQTAPAMSEIVEALVTGGGWPAGLTRLGVTPDTILPDRLLTASD